MPDVTVDVTTNPDGPHYEREPRTGPSKASRPRSAEGSVHDEERRSRLRAAHAEGGAELRVVVGDAYIRALSGKEEYRLNVDGS